MWQDWIFSNWTAAGMTVVSTVVFYAALIIFTRLSGLRSFSKMSSFDFAMTIALGSLFASVAASPSPPLLLGLLTLGMLYLGQNIIALCRRWAPLQRVVDNTPLLLMADGQVLEGNLRKANLTRNDIRAKLREHNVHQYDQVKAMVFETTGDVSVLHGEQANSLDDDLLRDVRGV
ncbi:DUF421 domain-containing protein [bacterium]|uniref:YetF C-terminal domain-containing protein n=2 Tax=Rubinisphaera brasiliensis TaxID=119 RepID=F0SKI6_RUBBR|nr:protein of unknown function DUF421 [Rubinisphaera brasiliensis DSM 5305]MBB03540.1 DUF421 domain-containing protein [Planctomyces sp.]MBR9801023.1 DUF421 domain-containing protein [bacterium]